MTMPRTSTRACTSPLGQKWQWSHFEGPRQVTRPAEHFARSARGAVGKTQWDAVLPAEWALPTANWLVSDPIPLDLGFMSMCHVPFETGFLKRCNK